MSKKDIHKIDNYLIRAGIFCLFLLFLYGSCTGGIQYLILSAMGPEHKLFEVNEDHSTQTFTSTETLQAVQARFPEADVKVIEHEDLIPTYENINWL